MNNSGQRQQGITLIEILVTVIILSIGFLGLASVQLMGTKNVANSQYRTLATLYAYDMAERMRANLGGVGSNSYNDTSTKSASDPKCDPCGIAQQADYDLYQWKQLIEANVNDGGLPEGVGGIEYISEDELYEITIAWSAKTNSQASGAAAIEDGSDAMDSIVLAVKL